MTAYTTEKPYKKRHVDLSHQVMKKISQEKIEVEPKWHFVVGSFFTTFGLVTLLILAAYLFALSFYLLKMHSSLYYLWFGSRGARAFVETFPVMYLVLAMVTLVGGVMILRKYDIAYKMKQEYLVVGLLMGLLVAILGMESMGLNTTLSKKRAVRALYMQYSAQQHWYKGQVDMVDRRRMMVKPLQNQRSLMVEWTENTSLPKGERFLPGEWVIMIGDWKGQIFVAEGISSVGNP